MAPPVYGGYPTAVADSAPEQLSVLASLERLIRAEMEEAESVAAAEIEDALARAAVLRRAGEEEARSVLAEAERRAHDTIARADAAAKELEDAGRLRAREIRAGVEARLWAHLESLHPGSSQLRRSF